MSDSSSLGLHALLPLLGEWRHGGTAHAELAEALELLLVDGRVRSGSRLPAERELATGLGVSRTTIVSAFRSLRERGVLRSVQGSGSVLELSPESSTRLSASRATAIDLSKATPPAWGGLERLTRAAVDHLPRELERGSGLDFEGIPTLRRLIAQRFTERGAPTAPENIMITLGAQHAIGLVARAFLGRGDRIVVESPSYPHALDAFRTVGARPVPIPLAHGRWDIGQITATIQDARPALAYLMPDFQNPTGLSMSDHDRDELIGVAARTGTPLVIDETTAELDIDRPVPTTPFAAFPARGATIITLGSVSKTIWNGLRVGWIRADRHIIDRLVTIRPGVDMGNTVLDQLVVAETFPQFDDVLAARREELRVGRATITQLLAERLPGWEVPLVHGGLAIWVNLGAPLSSALVHVARDRGVTVTAGPRFGLEGAFERNLRIPLTLPSGILPEGLARLADAWESFDTERFAMAPRQAIVV